jgi:hypothetical protein
MSPGYLGLVTSRPKRAENNVTFFHSCARTFTTPSRLQSTRNLSIGQSKTKLIIHSLYNFPRLSSMFDTMRGVLANSFWDQISIDKNKLIKCEWLWVNSFGDHLAIDKN